MSDSPTIADDLKAARALLEKGWCKNALEDGRGNCCVLGAIALATAGNAYEWNDRSQHAAVLVADQLPGGALMTLMNVNNAYDTTQQDMLNLMDKALAELGALA